MSPHRTLPDDAPPSTEEFFGRAEIRHGGTVIRRGRPPLPSPKAAVRLDAATGRVLLGGWGVGVLSYSVSDWVFRNHSSLDLNVIPWLVLAGVALLVAVVALVTRRRRTKHRC